MENGESSQTELLVDDLVAVNLIYVVSAAVLYSVFARASSNHLVQIRLGLNELIVQQPSDIAVQVAKFRKYYLYHAEYIHQMNRFFSSILLLEIFSGTVGTIIQIIYLVLFYINDALWYSYVVSASYLILWMIDMLSICLVSDDISQEVLVNHYKIVIESLITMVYMVISIAIGIYAAVGTK